jgi:predicted short-subunit dehydrogenase-like oxidoreductase (DUF2520 family)
MPVAGPTFPLRVSLVAAGSVGTIVARSLQARGHVITSVWSRSESSARLAANRLGCSAARSPEEAVADANVVLIGAADDAIGDVARSVAPGVRPGRVVVHFAGSHGIDVLAPAMETGAAAAALHPVQALPDYETGLTRLPGSSWGVTCSEGLVEWATVLVENELDGHPVQVAEGDRPLWHAAAVMTSNGVAALMGSGMALLEAIGVPQPRAVLGPLAAGTVANVRVAEQASSAFTGPIVRGDLATVERHVDGLRTRAPELLEAYRLAAELVIAGALGSGRIDDVVAAAARATLERS